MSAEYHPSPVGFLSRLWPKGETRRVREAREREHDGDLAGAAELFEEAGLLDDAARVLLLRADAEASIEKRIAFCALAAQKAGDEELKKKAIGRKALCHLRRPQGAAAAALMKNEMLSIARDLETAGENERAAEAFALAGDAEGEVRALTAAGAIERLEERLRTSDTAARDRRDLDAVLRRIDDLDRTAERRAALGLAREALARHTDERVVDAARRIRARLLRGPVVDLEIEGAAHRAVLGAEVSIGRGDAGIVIASRAVSRRHLRIYRQVHDGAVMVEDLGGRNGTLLAGARLAGAVPIGYGLTLQLGGEVKCVVEPSDSGVMLDVAGVRYEAPLGPLTVGDWRVGHEGVGEETYVVLSTAPDGIRPFLGEYQLAARIELCAGDSLATARNGEPRLRVHALGAPEELTFA